MYVEGCEDVFDFEKQWIRRIKQDGNEDSANKLIHKYYKEIFAYTYKQVFDQQLSMDLTQEIFIRALQSIQNFDDKKGTFRTWIYQIATNHCTDYFRSKVFQTIKQTDIVEQVEIDGEDEVLKQVFQKQQLEEIHQIMSTLDKVDRQILFKKLFDELTFLEIAEKLHIPLSTAKTKYYKAIKILKIELEANAK